MSHVSKGPILAVCFLVKLGERFFPETQVVTLLDQVRQHYLKNAEIIDGAISIRFDGDELLGPLYWEEIQYILLNLDNLLKGNATEEYLPLSGCWITLSPVEDELHYELRESKNLGGSVLVSRRLPLYPFIQQWELMYARLLKLKAALSEEGAAFLTYPEHLSRYSPEMLEIVGEERLQRILLSDLATVLQEGGCNLAVGHPDPADQTAETSFPDQADPSPGSSPDLGQADRSPGPPMAAPLDSAGRSDSDASTSDAAEPLASFDGISLPLQQPDNQRLLEGLRQEWHQSLQAGRELTLDIQLLSDEADDANPLAYDIYESNEGVLSTFTVVEHPAAVERFLGLAQVTPAQAHEVMRKLLTEVAHASGNQSSETHLIVQRRGSTAGQSVGFLLFPDGDGIPYRTTYQHWFTGRMILDGAERQNGRPLQGLKATLSNDGHLSIEFD